MGIITNDSIAIVELDLTWRGRGEGSLLGKGDLDFMFAIELVIVERVFGDP